MKKLKFMLAAATAIGLASATQADQYNTTGFEKLAVGTNVMTGVQDNRTGYSYFYYAGATAEDNESVIAEGTPDIARPRGAAAVDEGRSKILQVSTGTDPLMRTYKGFTGSSPVAASTLTTDTYVDALVQFTVTPYTDTVTPGANDKLMIYLKESTNEVEGAIAYSTNLVVVGGFYASGATTPREYVLDIGASHMKVEPNTWHRLTVKAIVDISAGLGAEALQMPGFAIWVDGEECTLDYYTMDENDQMAGLIMAANPDVYAKKQVLSLLNGSGMQPATLQGVGFAGEGKVDDIVFSDVDPFATVFDFTFAFDPQKVSAVTYTVGGVTNDQARTFAEVEADTEVKVVSITYADAWMAGTLDAVNLSDPVAGVYTVTNAGASLTINPEQFFPRTNTADQDGSAAHPYEVADGAALKALQKGLLTGKNLTGKNFQMTSDIDMTGVTDFYGIGWFTSSDSKDASLSGLSGNHPFTGVFDGNGRTISNVSIVKHNYAGIFNCIDGATIKNLTVSNVTFSGTCSESGFAIVGNSYGASVLENLTSAGTWPADMNHNTAGIAVRAQGDTLFTNCVNYVNLTTSSKRLGGILAFSEDPASASDPGVRIYNCTNYGNLSSTDGSRGVAGILSRSEAEYDTTTIGNCANFGTLTATGANGFTGQIVGQLDANSYRDDGGNTFLASANIVGDFKGKAVSNLFYAVDAGIDGMNYLTTVKPSDLAAGNTYTLLADVAASETPVFALAVGETIAFDTARGFTFAGTIVGDPAIGVRIDSETVGTITTYTGAQFTAPSTELEPGEKKEFSAEPSAAELAAITIVPSDAVSNALETAGVSIATYTDMFETVATYDKTAGKWYAEVVPTAVTTNALQIQVNAGVAEVVTNALTTRSVTITATPGFYYWVEHDTALSANLSYTTERVLATGNTVNIPLPSNEGVPARFYKVKADIVPAPLTGGEGGQD